MSKKLFKSLAVTAVLAAAITPVASASDLSLKEHVDYTFTTGTGQDAYFTTWAKNVDLAIDQNGKQYAHITFAGHSYAVEGFSVDGKEASILSSTGSAEIKDLVRVVSLPLDENGKGAIQYEGWLACHPRINGREFKKVHGQLLEVHR